MNIYTNELFREIQNQFDNITESDQIILAYLLEHTLWQFIHDTYDNSYKLPWTTLENHKCNQ